MLSLSASKEKNLHLALQLHAACLQNGHDINTSMGIYLISLFVEDGTLNDAQQVSDEFAFWNEWSWNFLVTSYVGLGKPKQALMLYDRMREDDCTFLSRHAFVASLKACATTRDLHRGRKIHLDVVQMGVEEVDFYIGSALIDMYAKCGLLEKAQQAFYKYSLRDAALWTTLMVGYLEHGQADQALNCFESMKLDGVSPDAITYVCSLKACTSLGDTEKGQEIHDEIERKGLLKKNVFLGSALVDLYAKCGPLVKAQQVFDELPHQDIVLWNSLIQGYGAHGHGEEALNCYERMQEVGVSPDAVTFACIMKVCGSVRAIKKGQQVHEEIERKGYLHKDVVLGNVLVDMYVKFGSFAKAEQVLRKLFVQDVVSWTALIGGYAEYGCPEEAVKSFVQMQRQGVSPNAVSFMTILKACTNLGDPRKGREMHAEIERRGLMEQDLIGNTVVDMYIKCGSLAQAQDIFDELPERNVITWNTLITGYADFGHGDGALELYEEMLDEGIFPDEVTFACILKACGNTGAVEKAKEIHTHIERQGLMTRDLFICSTLVNTYAKLGLLDKAQQVFNTLQNRDLVAWNALITGYAEHECAEEAIDCFEQMHLEHVSPNAITYICGLKACGISGSSNKGQQIHAKVARTGLLERDRVVGNTLVDMYSKCGILDMAQQVFHSLPVRDLVSWNSLMAGYTHLGSSGVFHVYRALVGEGIEPDSITFVIALSACNRKGFFEKCGTYFDTMSKDYGIAPTVDHYGCIVGLLSHAGHLDKAICVLKKLPLNPNLVAWHTLLGVCRQTGNVDIGSQVFKHVVSFDDQDVEAVHVRSHLSEGAL